MRGPAIRQVEHCASWYDTVLLLIPRLAQHLANGGVIDGDAVAGLQSRDEGVQRVGLELLGQLGADRLALLLGGGRRRDDVDDAQNGQWT